jgi:excisionase family DNA binding protein
VTAPLALSPANAALALGVARSTIYELLRTRQIRGRKLGTRTLIPVAELQRFLESLPEVEADREPVSIAVTK